MAQTQQVFLPTIMKPSVILSTPAPRVVAVEENDREEGIIRLEVVRLAA